MRLQWPNSHCNLQGIDTSIIVKYVSLLLIIKQYLSMALLKPKMIVLHPGQERKPYCQLNYVGLDSSLHYCAFTMCIDFFYPKSCFNLVLRNNQFKVSVIELS